MLRTLAVFFACAMLTSCATSGQATGTDTHVATLETVAPPAAETAAAPRSTETAEAEVRQASERFWSTQAQRDAAAVASQFTDGGILMVPGVADAVGRNAVRELLQKRFTDMRVENHKVEGREIQVTGDTAYEMASFAQTHVGLDASFRATGRYLLLWQREADGVWRVHRHLWNFSGMTPLPPPE